MMMKDKDSNDKSLCLKMIVEGKEKKRNVMINIVFRIITKAISWLMRACSHCGSDPHANKTKSIFLLFVDWV